MSVEPDKLQLLRPIDARRDHTRGGKARIGEFPADAAPMAFLGATALCGIGDPLSLLLAEHAFPESSYAAIAKIGVLLGSALAAVLGALALTFSPAPVTDANARPPLTI